MQPKTIKIETMVVAPLRVTYCLKLLVNQLHSNNTEFARVGWSSRFFPSLRTRVRSSWTVTVKSQFHGLSYSHFVYFHLHITYVVRYTKLPPVKVQFTLFVFGCSVLFSVCSCVVFRYHIFTLLTQLGCDIILLITTFLSE